MDGFNGIEHIGDCQNSTRESLEGKVDSEPQQDSAPALSSLRLPKENGLYCH